MAKDVEEIQDVLEDVDQEYIQTDISQDEIEHLTYLRIQEEYESSKRRRLVYRKYGLLFIILSGIIFLSLMFGLESKIQFLVLWVASCFYCCALMIRADYRYHTFAGYLGLIKKEEEMEDDIEETEEALKLEEELIEEVEKCEAEEVEETEEFVEPENLEKTEEVE